ncbi:sarcosine oxidase subunit gamma [Thalassobaculum fulvum]|uniref:Sarcosine oxidase subunit gamma n=1 Tax=Thalassobaculum fulvum TaxID=1633335 RepID=A0A919CQT3_9PROT|nr:sarcosine oxidase subunit gamma family protein [Thalassobaculum fulvum]GHD54253.1 sarcosine oxidase subunit gamma [Thalassobaculum fulvum]
MADTATPAARSPLDGCTGPVGGPSDAGVVLGELRFQGKINLRGDAADKAFAAAVAKAIGVEPPATPGTVATAGGRAILWLGPDEWLVVTPEGEGGDLAGTLNAALAGMRASATDVSDNYTTVRIAGPKARWVLAKGWAVDLHPRAFGPGRVAQSQLALTNAIIRQTDDLPSFEILVRPSFARYLWDWLTDASLEVGYRVEA